MPPSRLAEVIVVDDASTDATGAEIKALIEGGNCAGLHYLRHDHRSGQSAAMRSGILVATSPIIATMDGEVAYIPVNDRPRQAGISKYNNLNRALVGLYDLVGVTWLCKRTKVPGIAERHPETAQVRDLAARLKPVNDEGARLSAGDKS